MSILKPHKLCIVTNHLFSRFNHCKTRKYELLYTCQEGKRRNAPVVGTRTGSPQVTVSTMRFGWFPALVGRDRTDFQHPLYRIAGAFRFLYHRSTNSAYNAPFGYGRALSGDTVKCHDGLKEFLHVGITPFTKYLSLPSWIYVTCVNRTDRQRRGKGVYGFQSRPS